MGEVQQILGKLRCEYADFSEEDTLEDGDILPGFRLPLKKLFGIRQTIIKAQC